MKICHIITRLIIGGAQENTLLTCEGLHARGHDVTLLIGPDAGAEGSLLDRALACGYNVEVIPSLHRAIRPLADCQARRELRTRLRKLKPDVVHTHSSKAGIVGRSAASSAGVPVVIHTIHGMSFNRTQPLWRQKTYQWLERWATRNTDRILVVADAMAEQAISAGIAPPEKFTTVYSGMETEWYNPARFNRETVRAQFGFDNDAIVVGSVARLFPNKGYEQLIPAMHRAVQACPQLRFVWVGDGSSRQAYEDQLKASGIRSAVHLTGLVPPEQVAEVLAGVDMLVHASQWEGLPRAIVQALLMSKPVVSFDIDGAPEVVQPGHTGLLVPLNDINLLADSIVELADDSALRERMGQAGRSLCLERFDHELMVDRIEAVYKELANRLL